MCQYVYISVCLHVCACMHVCACVHVCMCACVGWWVHAWSHKTVSPSLHTNPLNHSLTFIRLRAHDLASAVVKAEGEGWAVGLHVTIETIIPFQPSDADGPRHVGQTKHLQLALSPQTGANEWLTKRVIESWVSQWFSLSASDSVCQSVIQSVGQAVGDSVPQPASWWLSQSVSQLVVQSIGQPVSDSFSQLVIQSVSQWFSQPFSNSVHQPASDSVSWWVIQPASQWFSRSVSISVHRSVSDSVTVPIPPCPPSYPGQHKLPSPSPGHYTHCWCVFLSPPADL